MNNTQRFILGWIKILEGILLICTLGRWKKCLDHRYTSYTLRRQFKKD